MIRLLLALALYVLLVGSASAQGGMQPGPGTPAATAGSSWTINATAFCRYTGPSTTCTIPSTNTTTGGTNLLVAVIVSLNLATTSPASDSAGNTWTAAQSATSGTSSSAQLFYVISPATSSTYTVGAFGNNSYAWMYVYALTGSGGTPSYDASHAGACGSTTLTQQPGSITPSVGHSMVFSATSYNDPTSTGTLTVNSSMTLDHDFLMVAAQSYGGAVAHLEQNPAAAINPTWTASSTGTDMCAIIGAFHP